jgi:hypothetical protein
MVKIIEKRRKENNNACIQSKRSIVNVILLLFFQIKLLHYLKSPLRKNHQLRKDLLHYISRDLLSKITVNHYTLMGNKVG